MAERCTIDGIEHLPGASSAEATCSHFEQLLHQQLAAQINADGGSMAIEPVSIALSIEKRGAIKAKVTASKNGSVTEYPEVGFDVMDRPLRESDLEPLAAAVARVLAQ